MTTPIITRAALCVIIFSLLHLYFKSILIDECDIENDIFFRKVLQLPADILILTEQDYSEYGFHTINFKKTGNNKYE